MKKIVNYFIMFLFLCMHGLHAQNFYDILGISKTASLSEIKAAYLKSVKELHPDVNKAQNATYKFQELNQAYETLKDGTQRAEYDKKFYREKFSSFRQQSYQNSQHSTQQAQKEAARDQKGFEDLEKSFQEILKAMNQVKEKSDQFRKKSADTRQSLARNERLLSRMPFYVGAAIGIILFAEEAIHRYRKHQKEVNKS